MKPLLGEFSTVTPEFVRTELLAKRELALLDVREEALHATGHPLFAANLPLSRIELEAYTRLPRRSVPIVLMDNGEGLALTAALVLRGMGYSNIFLLANGLQGWRDAGYEVFIDVNAPSKAFGELVEAKQHTPSLSAEQVQEMIETRADCVILDVRRYDEYHTMSIPTAVSVPGAEIVLRVRDLAPRPDTTVIVNCAGRTRSIIGAQSLLNAGIPNPVAALRNGTIGWKLAQQSLVHDAKEHFRNVDSAVRADAAGRARKVADFAGVARLTLSALNRLIAAEDSTAYRFDVRTPDEFRVAHLPGFRSAPGGQLVQEMDMYAPVRGARIILADDDGVRANMTASWLAQMGWNVAVLDGLTVNHFSESGSAPAALPRLPPVANHAWLAPAELQIKCSESGGSMVILDFAPARQYERLHIVDSWYALRSSIPQVLERTAHATSYTLTSPDGLMARFAYADLQSLTSKPVFLLQGGTSAWESARMLLTPENPRFACDPLDYYRRPYEGTETPDVAMRAYLEWEYGLVAQLERDGTHGFFVIAY
jgi:rhodanese-related sulfurtransferase